MAANWPRDFWEMRNQFFPMHPIEISNCINGVLMMACFTAELITMSMENCPVYTIHSARRRRWHCSWISGL